MKYILLVHHDEVAFGTFSEAKRRQMLEESVQLTHQLHANGQYMSASPLHPASTAAVVRVRDGKPFVTDGPFVETREQLAGYFLIHATNLDEAIGIAARVPGARIGTVEVRPVKEVAGLPAGESPPRAARSTAQPDTHSANGQEGTRAMATRHRAAEDTDRELVIIRILDAARSLVFKAWTEAAHLARWQGAPQGFAVTSHQMDLRPGGAFRVCMRSPEDVDYWLQGVYREIAEPEQLAFTHVWLDAEGKPGQETLVTITLTERGGKTELTLHQSGFNSIESRDGHRAGWTSTLDRLAEYLAEVHARPSDHVWK